jgi:hypothetical protein
VTAVESGRDYRVKKDPGGKFSPIHRNGECPKSEKEADQMSTKKKAPARKKAPVKKKAATKKKAPARKKAASKKKKPYSKGRATAKKDSKGRFLNHQGRETLKATVYGMLREGKTDKQIKQVLLKKFPVSQFHDHATAHLAWYKCMIEKEKE